MNKTQQEINRENEQKHLDWPFYQKAHEMREHERQAQILKGAYKYPQPFTPSDWSPRQLLSHALQENIDQAHYIVGLYDLLEDMEQRHRSEVEVLRMQLDAAEREAEYWKLQTVARRNR